MGTLSFNFIFVMEGLFFIYIIACIALVLWEAYKTPKVGGDKSDQSDQNNKYYQNDSINNTSR